MGPFKKIVCVIVLVLAVSFLAGKVADKSYRRFYRPFYNKFNTAFKDTTRYDVVFFGNSTVHFGINPYYVDSVTGLKTFNLGYAGANINTIAALFYGYLEVHRKPTAIVLTVEEYSLQKENDLCNAFPAFDYLHNHSLSNYLTYKGYHPEMVKFFPFVQYSFFSDYDRTAIVKGFSGSPMENNAVEYNGFLNNIPGLFKNGIIDLLSDPKDSILYKPGLDTLCNMLAYCKQQNIQVLFSFPPRIYNGQHNTGTDKIDSFSANIASRYQMPYKRFNTPDLFRLDEFADGGHLNNNGATHYSICIGQYIDSVLHIDCSGTFSQSR